MVRATIRLLVLLFAVRAFAADPAPSERLVTATYKSLASLDGAERRVIFRGSSPAMKAALWRLQLKMFLQTHPSLTVTQRNIISDALSLLNPGLYEGSDDDARWVEAYRRPLRLLEEQAVNEFEAGTAAALFGQLGVHHDLAAAVAATTPSQTTSRHVVVGTFVETQGNPGCQCAVESDLCGWHQKCGYAGCTKDTDWPACGMFWRYDCDGNCYDDPAS